MPLSATAREGPRAGSVSASAGNAQRPGEPATSIRGTAQPQGSLIFCPGGVESTIRPNGDVQASVVPVASSEASFAITGDAVRKIDWVIEGFSAVG